MDTHACFRTCSPALFQLMRYTVHTMKKKGRMVACGFEKINSRIKRNGCDEVSQGWSFLTSPGHKQRARGRLHVLRLEGAHRGRRGGLQHLELPRRIPRSTPCPR